VTWKSKSDSSQSLRCWLLCDLRWQCRASKALLADREVCRTGRN